MIIFFFISNSNVFSIQDDKEKNELYLKGINALKVNDKVNAEKFFKESIRLYDDAGSHYQIAKIYLERDTYTSRNFAYEHFRKAVWKEPDNLEYRYAFATLMKDFARVSSIDEFEKIILQDSTYINAWINLGEIKAEDFSEYNFSVRDMGEIYGDLQEYAYEDFLDAEKYFKNALVYDSLNIEASLQLALLYEEANLPRLGIPILKRLINNKRSNKDIFLCLGLLNYKISDMKESFNCYKNALELMNNDERTDFTINSVREMLQPAYHETIDQINEYEMTGFINDYWKVSDPLYLTDYNERLLEHYSRIAYANLKFSVPSMGVIGWRSNRGEVMLRYGEPISRMRIRPSMGDTRVNMKTDVWNYENMTLGFTDMAQSGNFLFATPPAPKDKVQPQFGGDTHFMMDNLRRLVPILYNPKFDGPRFDINYEIVQFKSFEKRNHADVYVNYILDADDSLFENEISLNHKVGFFFLDKDYREQFRRVVNVKLDETKKEGTVKNFNATVRADSGFASFEIIRDIDKGTSSNRSELNIRRFSNNHLDISDIVLALDVSRNKPEDGYFDRRSINILPNPTRGFKQANSIFIYYEIYNLKKDKNNLTDFEQNISISEIDEQTGIEKVVSTLLNIFSSSGKEKLTLTSNYKTLEADPQIFLQLDLSKYPANKYLITVTVKDKLENREVKSSAIVDWKN
ncbi:MAG: GWxTD domain-containing protein [Bacteroidota bacterium]